MSLWDDQVGSFFETQTTVLRQAECTPAVVEALFGGPESKEWCGDLRKVQGMLDAAAPERERRGVGRWQAALRLSTELMAAAGSVRHIPVYHPARPVPQKCTLLGTYEQMGPAEWRRSQRFWEQARLPFPRLREGERLCAVSLVKRFAFEATLRERLEAEDEETRFPSTQDVAARAWRAADDARPVYYAVLMLDGDELGKWLSGQKSPAIRKTLDVGVWAHLERLPGAAEGLDARRPVTPALHAAISEALANFALHIAPRVVERHQGVLIYAGGDDVLALLPTRTALACARELRLAYSGHPAVNGGAEEGFYRLDGRDLLTMGQSATASAGLLVAHHKEDMRLVLEGARAAEKRAKGAGRDRLAVGVWRRSGEHAEAVCTWNSVAALEHLVNENVAGASDRWTYHLRRELPTLTGLDEAAQKGEVRRLLARMESERRIPFESVEPIWNANKPLENFVTLCQSASFLARGREL